MGNKEAKTPIEATLALFTNKWKLLIIRELLTGTKRFSQLYTALPNITQKVLTTNLRALEGDGFIVRKIYPEIPPRVEYTLTEKGESLDEIVDCIERWGDKYAV